MSLFQVSWILRVATNVWLCISEVIHLTNLSLISCCCSQGSKVRSTAELPWWRWRRRRRRGVQGWGRVLTLLLSLQELHLSVKCSSFTLCSTCRWHCKMPGEILWQEEVEDLCRSSDLNKPWCYCMIENVHFIQEPSPIRRPAMFVTWLQCLLLCKPTDPEFCTRSDVPYVNDCAF